MEIGVVIIFIAFLVIVAPFISTLTRIPIVVVEMLLGAFGAYLGILGNFEIFKIVSQIGFLYLMFLAGMEVNLREFKMGKSSLLKRAIIYFVMLYTLAIVVTLYFNLSAVYIVTFPIFSLGILMALVKEYGKNEPWLGLALNIGIVGELISILAIAILSGSLESGFSVGFFINMLGLFIFLAIFVLVFKFAKVLFWWFPELRVMLMPYHDNKDTDIRLSMALMFSLVGLMMVLNVDKVLGAFLAGLFIRSFFKHKTDLPEKLSSFGFGFLVPIFFIYVGSTLPLSVFLDKDILLFALFISGTLFIIRLISSMTAYLTYFGFRNTLLFSLSDSMPLTFLVAIATLAYNAGAISNNEYYSFVVASMINAVLFMIVIKILYQLFFKKNKNSTPTKP
ncbi:MAG: cation:proton antiporter [Campylobacteraceae bacterium]